VQGIKSFHFFCLSDQHVLKCDCHCKCHFERSSSSVISNTQHCLQNKCCCQSCQSAKLMWSSNCNWFVSICWRFLKNEHEAFSFCCLPQCFWFWISWASTSWQKWQLCVFCWLFCHWLTHQWWGLSVLNVCGIWTCVRHPMVSCWSWWPVMDCETEAVVSNIAEQQWCCWTRRNVTEPVSVRVSPCVQRVPGPMQAATLSEEDSTSSDPLARPSKSLSSLISATFRVKCPRPTLR